jgi:hypothetical protein
MSQTEHEPHAPSTTADESLARLAEPLPAPERATSATWQSWAYFGAALMATMGLFWAIVGLVALVDQDYFTVRENTLLVASSYTTWGWVHLIGGLVSVAAGAGIIWGGRRWARTAGIVIAGVSAVVNLGFLRASPAWSAMVIALDILVIYALTVHGVELDES